MKNLPPCSSEVEEILKFLDQSSLLSATPESFSIEATIVPQPPEMGRQSGLGGIPLDEVELGGFIYDDYRESALSDAIAAAYDSGSNRNKNSLLSELTRNDELMIKIGNQIESRLYFAVDWIYSDIFELIEHRFAFGKDSKVEWMVDVYRQGGWPVGWDVAPPPEGRPLVVLPANRPTSENSGPHIFREWLQSQRSV